MITTTPEPGIFHKDFKFRLTVNIFFITGFLAILLMGSYVYFKSDRFTRGLKNSEIIEMLESFARTLGTAGGITSAVFVGQNLYLTIEKQRQEQEEKQRERQFTIEKQIQEQEEKQKEYEISSRNRAQDILIRQVMEWNDPSLLPIRHIAVSKIDNIINQVGENNLTDQRVEIQKLMESDSIFRENSKTILNFLEAIAIYVEKRIIDKEEAFDYFGILVVRMGSLYHNWIIHEQDKPKRRFAFNKLMELREEWEIKIP
jgi:hypothetical protein